MAHENHIIGALWLTVFWWIFTAIVYFILFESSCSKDEDLKNLDPDLKMAILKMRKLDRILAKKEKREKEVKRDRILLQAR